MLIIDSDVAFLPWLGGDIVMCMNVAQTNARYALL